MVSGGGNFLFYCKLSVSYRVPRVVQVIRPDDSENRVLCASGLRSEVMGGFSAVVNVSTILSSV